MHLQGTTIKTTITKIIVLREEKKVALYMYIQSITLVLIYEMLISLIILCEVASNTVKIINE